MAQIDIASVMARLNETYDETTREVKNYALRFINAQGETREVVCRKNVKSPALKPTDRPAKGREQFNLKLHGTVQVYDLVTDHPRTIKVAMIYGFKEHKSNQWLNVFH